MALKRRNRWMVGAGVAGVVAVLGYLLMVWGLTAYATQKISSSTGQPTSIERLVFNPFTATLSLRGLVLGEASEPIVRIDKGSATLDVSSLWQSGLHISEIALEGARLHMITDASGELNLETLGGSEDTQDEENDSAMRVVIDHVSVSDGQMDWVDKQASPQGELSLRDMTVSLADYDSEQSDPMHGNASARLGEGRLEARGDFSPYPFTGDLQIKGEQLTLAMLNPWLARIQGMQIDSGVLQGQGRLAFGRAVSDDVLWQGDLAVAGLRILDQQGQDVFGLEQGAFNGMDIQGSEHLRAESVVLDAPDILVLLDEQGGLNLTSQPDSDDDEASSPGSQDASSREDDSDQQANMALGSLRINNGTFRFEDRQMSPVVQLDIRDVKGRMDAFDIRASTPTAFTLKGLESDDTPVAIEGSFSAGSSLSGEMSLTSKRLPLARFAPYVRRFGGYRIESGTADLDLHYQLEDGRVTASNHVVLRRLALDEEAVDNDASLPLRRLVGMLQGDDGVINLDIPIQATVDGGEVDIGGVVMQVLGEVLKNLATSPIDTLDAMINGDDNDTADERSSYTEGPLSQVATEPDDD